MSEEKVKSQAHSADMANYLLTARAKQIARLKQDIAGLEEALQLSETFISLFALALTQDSRADEAIRVCEQGGASPEVFVSRLALADALKHWHIEVKHHDDGYLLSFHQSSAEA
ncbi:MAG: hypothetical protein E7639_03900 [Ruminococcaceae bacterium]|nr:hypothetical protein [Oscillospiraceae bacterium]